jgi:hypothetical protein
LLLPTPDPSDLLTALFDPCRIGIRVSEPSPLAAFGGVGSRPSSAGFYLVLDGWCVLEIPVSEQEFRLGPRDLALLTRGVSHRLHDQLASPAVSARPHALHA